jgi:RNA polymerase subunit RPABC4/transcription elongation factor Spt4
MKPMSSTLVIVCHNCGGLLLAKTEQKTRTCPYCGSTVVLQKARKLAVANTATEASAILRKMKSEAAQR